MQGFSHHPHFKGQLFCLMLPESPFLAQLPRQKIHEIIRPQVYSRFLWCFGDLATVETVWLEWFVQLGRFPANHANHWHDLDDPSKRLIFWGAQRLLLGFFLGVFSHHWDPLHIPLSLWDPRNPNHQPKPTCFDWKDRPVQLCSVIIGPIMPGVSRSMGHVWLWVICVKRALK